MDTNYMGEQDTNNMGEHDENKMAEQDKNNMGEHDENKMGEQNTNNMGEHDENKMGEQDKNNMGEHDKNKMGEQDKNNMGEHDKNKMGEQDKNNMGEHSGVEDHVSEFEETFQLFDHHGDGNIDVTQIGEVVRALGLNPTESEVKKCSKHLKTDEWVSFEVFLPIYQAISLTGCGDTASDFNERLRHFDKDGNGFISSVELRLQLTTLGEKLTDDEVDQLLQGHEDSEGNINYEKFVKHIMQG